MLFNQIASSLLQSHGDQLFAQLAFRLRSFLIHCVTLRSFGSTPPGSSSWKAVSSKVLVRVSQDSAIISGAVIMSGMIVPNIAVVGVGFYSLFKYINLAFLGPLLAAATCFAAPMSLGGPLSRSQRKSLEAAESRIQVATAARQATQTRLGEVEAATIFRRVLAVVIVISVFTMSLANPAAFGGVALLPGLSFDYTVLVASLSTIQIMITPLLSIIQMLPELFSSWVSWKRICDYVAEDKSGDPTFESEHEADGLQFSNSISSSAPEPAVDIKPASHSDEVTTLVEGTSGQIGNKSRKVIVFGIDKGGSFWLSHSAGQYADSRERTKTGYYIGVYAAFAAARLVMLFALIWTVFIKLIPTSGISLQKNMLLTLVKTPATTTELNQSETVNKFINDIEGIDQALPQALQNLAAALASSLASLGVIAIGSPYAIISLVILLPLLWFLQKVYLATSFQLRTLQIAARAPMLEVASGSVQGRLTVRALRGEGFMSRIISERTQHAILMGYLFTSVQNWAILMLSLLNVCLATAVAGLLVGLGGSRSASWGGLALVNTISLGQEAMLLLTWWTRFESSMASIERIFDYTHDKPQEKIATPAAVITDSWPEAGNISFENLSLSHSSHVAAEGITVDIASGSKVAVLGRTGSGKTSLLQVFFGLIDNAGGMLHVVGVELFHVESDILRRRLVGHPQKYVANSSGTIRENLDPSGDAATARVEEVLSQVMAADMRDEVMSGLDAKWRDCNFSEGWQQQIGNCRTLLRDSKVYILDEPASGCDGRLAEHGSPADLAKDTGSMLRELMRADSLP
ncbi:hypothetical protein NLG97_g4364 [Lecanicillium saksenae]|uniref:Uncharacterized protein n=1 Tax=Lecanicillium saksenae TaxID=468837 RepID=A0ACC1QVH8_9HYPO|nr:hypothetical protein NLG97_g4364 [Lecanicillium saksenae]